MEKSKLLKQICDLEMVVCENNILDFKLFVERVLLPEHLLRLAVFIAKNPQFIVGHCVVSAFRILAKELTKESVPNAFDYLVEALSGKRPGNFLNFLEITGCDIFPEYTALIGCPQRLDHHPEGCVATHTRMVMDVAASKGYSPEVIFACLCHDMGKPEAYALTGDAHSHERIGLPHVARFCTTWDVPKSYRVLANAATVNHGRIHSVLSRGSNAMVRPATIYRILKECHAFTEPDLFLDVLRVCEADAKGRGKTKEEISKYLLSPYKQGIYMRELFNAVLEIPDVLSNFGRQKEMGKKELQRFETSVFGVIANVRDEWSCAWCDILHRLHRLLGVSGA